MYVVSEELIASHYPPFQKEVTGSWQSKSKTRFSNRAPNLRSDIYQLDTEHFYAIKQDF